jgi:L-2-hydroxycarboxylate dehydrogenase (NAD+)
MDYVVPVAVHNQLAVAAYRHRKFTDDEAQQAARFCELASWHGIRTHNLIKALHLDHLFGSQNKTSPGCVPGATVIKKPSKFDAAQKWNANRKLGQAVAFDAMEACMKLADKHGVGMVSVDQAFHYLWGGGYVMDAAKKGYIAYTNCTAALAEVVPFGGKFPTLGTNPHSWAFPTTDAVGFPIVIDWATSTIAMGRVQQFVREGTPLPPGAAVDKDGNPTTDANAVAALLPFGAHKGYGLSLINELVAAFIGGSLPTIRSRPDQAGRDEKTTPNFFFQVIHPDALDCGLFAKRRNQSQNVRAVLEDILGHGNRAPEGKTILPGEIEHNAAKRSERNGGLIFSEAEIESLKEIADECRFTLDTKSFKAAQA